MTRRDKCACEPMTKNRRTAQLLLGTSTFEEDVELEETIKELLDSVQGTP